MKNFFRTFIEEANQMIFQREGPPKSAIRVLDPDELEWHPPNTLPAGDTGIFWGGKRIPKSRNGHYCLIGTTQSGKTTSLRLLMQDVLPDVMLPNSNTRALIYDPKREFLPILEGIEVGKHVVPLDPFDARGFAWDMAADINTLEEATTLASLLVPERATSKEENHYIGAVRDLLLHVVYGFVLLEKEKQGPDRRQPSWTFRDVIAVMFNPDYIPLVAGRSSLGRQVTKAHLDGSDDTVRNLIASIFRELGYYAIIAALWSHTQQQHPKRNYSIDHWLTANDILVLPPPRLLRRQGDPVQRMNQFLFHRVAERTLHLGEAKLERVPRRNWFIIDELRFAGELPGLLELLTQGASKGARVVIALQDKSGLQDALNANRAEEVVGLCAHQAYFRATSEVTATWMAAQFNKKRIRVQGENIGPGGRTESYHDEDRPVLLDSHFADLPLPDRDTGKHLEGYYRTPDLNRHHAKLLAEVLLDKALLRPADPDECPAFQPRPAEEQELSLWDDSDLVRFGLAKGEPKLSKRAEVANSLRGLVDDFRSDVRRNGSSRARTPYDDA